MTGFLDWLTGGSSPDDTSAQNRLGVVPQRPVAPSVSVPAQLPPGAVPPPSNPADLPNIAGMFQDIKNAPPVPPSPAVVAAQVPPQGDNVPPLPAPVDVAPAPSIAASAPPTPPAPDASAGPAAPSDTPAGKSLLERIMGSNDASTKDSAGLTQADRHATGFDALAKLGFGIMAASMPQNPGQRAQTIAQLGSIPADMLKQRAALIGQQAQAQQVQLRQKQLDDAKRARTVLDSPEFQESFKTMPPQMQAVAKAAAAAGDIGTIVKLQSAFMPKLVGNNLYDPTKGTATNTITGVTTGGAPGQPGNVAAPGPGGAPAAPGAAPAADASPLEYNDDYIKQNVPAQFQDTVRAMAEGRQKMAGVTDRNGVGLQLNAWARNANKNLDQTTYDKRDKAMKSYSPDGVTGKAIVSLNTLLQHTNDLRHQAEALNNKSLPIVNKAQNFIETQTGGAAPDNFDRVRNLVTRELDNLVSSGRVTMSETEALRENLSSNKSPEQIQGAIDQITELAKARLQSATQQGQRALGKKGMQDIAEQLQNPTGLKALQDLEANPIKGSKRYDAKTQGAGAKAPAPGQYTPDQRAAAAAELKRRQQAQ